MAKEPWVAHEHPQRRFDAWMWLCDCEVCVDALKRESARRPRLLFCLKTSADRVYVTAKRLSDTFSEGEPADSLCYVEDDWVREVYVVGGKLPASMDWWSLTLAEEIREGAS